MNTRVCRADIVGTPAEAMEIEKAVFAPISGAFFGIYVSSLDGKRFANEFGDRKILTDSFLTVINKGGKALSIADSDGVAHSEKFRPGAFDKMLAEGGVKKCSDAESLAKCGFDG